MEKKEIVQIINFINSLYPNQKMNNDAATVQVWDMMLSEFDMETVKIAIRNFARRKKFAPTVSEIIEMIESVYSIAMEVHGSSYCIRITGTEDTMLFRYDDRTEANVMLAHFRTHPPIEDVRILHAVNVRDVNPYTTSYSGPYATPARGKEIRYQYENYKKRKVAV